MAIMFDNVANVAGAWQRLLLLLVVVNATLCYTVANVAGGC